MWTGTTSLLPFKTTTGCSGSAVALLEAFPSGSPPIVWKGNPSIFATAGKDLQF